MGIRNCSSAIVVLLMTYEQIGIPWKMTNLGNSLTRTDQVLRLYLILTLTPDLGPMEPMQLTTDRMLKRSLSASPIIIFCVCSINERIP